MKAMNSRTHEYHPTHGKASFFSLFQFTIYASASIATQPMQENSIITGPTWNYILKYPVVITEPSLTYVDLFLVVVDVAQTGN